MVQRKNQIQLNQIGHTVDLHYNTMKTKIKRMWVAALRSGRYVQVKGSLKRKYAAGNERHCCLGVLCELHAKATKATKASWTVSVDKGHMLYLGSRGVLPQRVVEWAGLTEPSPYCNRKKTTLLSMNDGGATFAKIANEIEKDKLS